MKKPSKKALAITGIATVATVIALAAGGLFAYTQVYKDKVYPGISVNGVALEGMTFVEAQEALEAAHTAMLQGGLAISHDATTKQLEIQLSGSTDPDLVYDVILYDPSEGARTAIAYNRSGDALKDAFTTVRTIVEDRTFFAPITILEQPIEDVILAAYGEIESSAVETRLILNDLKNGDVGVEVGSVGEEIDFDQFFVNLSKDLRDFDLGTQTIELTQTDKVITESEALSHVDDLIAVIDKAPLSMTYTTQALRDYEWDISADNVMEWNAVRRSDDGQTKLMLESEGLDELMTEIGELVNVAPQNARFQVEDGLATEFAGSSEGVSLNAKATLVSLNNLLTHEDNTITLTTIVEEPEVSTKSVNDLGINEVLGTGYSDFSGSPANRLANLRHGVSKLNGMLIPPGDVVSLIDTLKPFTIADGYLPELVIKGDEIIPEIGGGLCQIGTTTFRAVMNSGLQIDERRNHSLVVNYYNDPSNGNPGTDATLYDPAPDFKFTNDTENYILLEAKMLDTDELEFTFWGTSDGRDAYYTPPEVLSWSGYGATQYTETDELAPGVTRCQSPHPGATTSFDYIVTRPDGTEELTNYTSTYRSLPRICLVGASAPGEGELSVDDVE